MFGRVGVRDGDLVMVPTVTDFELECLTRYLAEAPGSRAASWHLQFFDAIVEGREPEYAAQADTVERRAAELRAALATIPQHRLHFYVPTDTLRDQYATLNIGAFHLLPYPIDPTIRGERGAQRPDRPLRVTLLGGPRRTRGHDDVPRLVRDLWDAYLAPGRLEFVIQTNEWRLWNWRFRLRALRRARRGDTPAPVICIPHPASPELYAELVRQSDIGLLTNDSLAYYARHSGVFSEFLCAGVPVIVAPGCWMATQIAQPTFDHLDRASHMLTTVRRLTAQDVEWDPEVKRPDSRLVIEDGAEGVRGGTSVPAEASELLVRFRWRSPTDDGTFLRLQVEQAGQDGRPRQTEHILGHRSDAGDISALVHLEPDVDRVQILLTNAYGESGTELDDLELLFVASRNAFARGCPLGAVGLTASGSGQIGAAIREIVTHYEHYRETAAGFSRIWGTSHCPERTVAALVARAREAV